MAEREQMTIGELEITSKVIRRGRRHTMYATRGKVGGTAGWVPAGATDVIAATCPASQTGSTLVIPITGVRPGDTITGFNLVGQVESAGNNVVLDAALRKMTPAAADNVDALVASMTQLTVSADTALTETNTSKTGLTEVVAEDEFFYVLVTATTGASTDIALLGVSLHVTEA